MMEPATKLVMFVSIHFMILFTAFNAFQTIVTKIHEEEGDHTLGPFRFALNYFTFMIANLFVSKVKYSQKWQITLSTLTYVFQYLTGFFISGTSIEVKFIMAGLGAVVNGIGASFLWTSIGSYIHKVCHFYEKTQMKGHYYGMFNIIFCFSTILGSLVVTFGLSLFSTNMYFLLVSGVAMLSFVYGIFFIKDLSSLPNSTLMLPGDQTQKISRWQSIKQSAISTLKFYPIMKFTLGLILLDGTNIGVTTSTMLHLLPKIQDKAENHLQAGICLILYGCGCVIGGYFGGKLCDRLRIRLASTLVLYAFAMSCLFSMFADIHKEIWSARMACFLWGLVLYYISANLMVICSRLYGGKPESFALTKQFHCLSFVIYQIVAMSTNNSIPVIYIMIVLLGLGIPAMWGVCKSPSESSKEVQAVLYEENQDEDQPNNNREAMLNKDTFIIEDN